MTKYREILKLRLGKNGDILEIYCFEKLYTVKNYHTHKFYVSHLANYEEFLEDIQSIAQNLSIKLADVR